MASLNAFEGLFPGEFAIDNVFLPNEVLNFEFMLWLLVKDLIILFNPNSPHDKFPKNMPNIKPRFVLLSMSCPNMTFCQLNSWNWCC